ncbi:MAG: thiamine phosphate synthase [Actinomycetota bacterium]
MSEGLLARGATKSLMLVTDRKQCGSRPLAEVVAEAVEGGVNLVQLREPDLPSGELLALARQLRGVCGARAQLIINDRVDVALLSGADGVQLGVGALPVAAVRLLLPPSIKVGASVHSVREARQAELDGADYVIAGTIFQSPSHPEVAPAGPELLRNIATRLSIPVIAIGGVSVETVEACWSAGAAGVAVISAIFGAEDPRQAAARLAPAPIPVEDVADALEA